MAHMDKFMVFHSSGVDSSSVNSHDAGTDVDLGCFKVSDVTAVMAEEDFVYVYFKDATRFEGNWGHNNDAATYETMEQAKVRLTVGEGKEFEVIKDLLNLVTATGVGGYDSMVFDAVNDTWPINNVTAIVIYRSTTTYTIASDS